MPSVADWSLGWGVPGGTLVALLLFALVAGAIALGVAEVRSGGGRRRTVLVALRVATALVAWAVAVQPRWVGERVQQDEGRLALLVDASRSMTVSAGAETRVEQSTALLSRWRDAPRADEVEVATFGASLRGATLESLAEGFGARDDDTRLSSSVAELVTEDARGDLGAVVVVSDGADRSGPAAIERLSRLGVRVHGVAVGGDGALRDDTIVSIAADPVGFLRQPAQVRVAVRTSGVDDPAPIAVSLRLGEELVREVDAVPDDEGLAVVDLPFTPHRLGRTVYRVSIPVQPGDAVPENNERAFLVRVTREKLRVLLVAGRPSWDERFLRSFLKRDPSIDLISFFILRTASDLTMAAPDELALIPFPTDELFSEHLGSFDLVVFQNFEYGPYQMAGYLPRIRDYVLRGGAFAMVGGELSFASGGYSDTGLADVLPVTMPPSGTPVTRAVVSGRFAPRMAPDSRRHPLLELLPDPAANQRAWARLSPLEGANALTGLRGDGRALLLHPSARTGAGPMPILAVGTAGRGRTLAFATDTSWRWGITTGGVIGDASAYERFWDRALRWLARDPSLEPAQITTDRERYGPGATVRLSALLRDEAYEPLADRRVRLSIVDENGDETAAREVAIDGEGRAEVELEGPVEPGGYRVVARLVDEVDDRCEEGLVVEEGGDELADPRARPDLLAEIAEATGGTFHDVDDAPALDRYDSTRTRSLGIVEVAPLATPWAFMLVVLLFGAEWLLRRMWGRR